MFDYTAGDDRPWDARLLRWDVLGSLGHVEGLRASGLLTAARARAAPRGLRAALREVEAGRLRVSPRQEDVHTAVEAWLTRRLPGLGERLHTGRSRNDQVATDLRLYLKDRAARAARGRARRWRRRCSRFAARHRTVLWPGYTHQRRAMPSSVGLWARGLRRGRARHRGGAASALGRGWTAHRSAAPRATASPLPLKREAAARALGFAGARPQRGHGARRAGQARGRGALLVHPAGPRARPAGAGRHPVQRRGVRLPGAARRAGDRLEHHAAQAQPRPVRADPGPGGRARGRPRRRCSRSRASWPGAISATSSSSRSR